MKNKSVKKNIQKNDTVMNALALEFFLENGRNTLLNDVEYNKFLKKVENDYDTGKGSKFVTKDYALQIIKTSRQLALLDKKDLYDLISNEIVNIQKIEQENASPDYEY